MNKNTLEDSMYIQSNIVYLQDCCKKYGIKHYSDYKALKKFVKIFDDLINKELITFKEQENGND